MSAAWPKTLPQGRISSTARAVESAERPQMATSTPSRSRRSAMARPMPRVPPVTIAALPWSVSICGFYAGANEGRKRVVRIATGMPPSAQKSALRRLFEDRLSQLASDVDGIVAGDIEKARREFAEQLNQAARRLRQSADTEELRATLADAAAGFAAGAAFFPLESEFARGERIRGGGGKAAERFRGLRVPLTSAAALAGAVESKDPVT